MNKLSKAVVLSELSTVVALLRHLRRVFVVPRTSNFPQTLNRRKAGHKLVAKRNGVLTPCKKWPSNRTSLC